MIGGELNVKELVMYESLDDAVLGDLKDLSKWIGASDSAARVSRICTALRTASGACGEARRQSDDDLTRHQIAKLDEGFAAAARIVARFSEDSRAG
ncbi:hypothetical protein AB3X96_38825 [Paraburkholderia sp. BR13439]|uniref:hypothetical protein n=1 Tax=Paraburkholderia TaxID=1822464 RepID=UPI0034CFACD9